MDQLSKGLDAAFSLLRPGGRLAIITFHSLEDRMVKQRMNEWGTGCICPPDFPVCVCGNQPKAQLVYKKDWRRQSRSWSRIPAAAAHGYVSARSFSEAGWDLNKFFSEQMHGSVTRCYNKNRSEAYDFSRFAPKHQERETPEQQAGKVVKDNVIEMPKEQVEKGTKLRKRLRALRVVTTCLGLAVMFGISGFFVLGRFS